MSFPYPWLLDHPWVAVPTGLAAGLALASLPRRWQRIAAIAALVPAPLIALFTQGVRLSCAATDGFRECFGGQMAIIATLIVLTPLWAASLLLGALLGRRLAARDRR